MIMTLHTSMAASLDHVLAVEGSCMQHVTNTLKHFCLSVKVPCLSHLDLLSDGFPVTLPSPLVMSYQNENKARVMI